MAYPDVLAAAVTGTATNNNALAGQVGEFVTATVPIGSAISLTTATSVNITSISLTAGDWDVTGLLNFNLTGATGTLFQSGPSLTTGVLPTQPGGAGLGTDALAILPIPVTGLTGDLTQIAGKVRVSIAATTTVFLVAQATFTVGTCTGFGTLRARRIR